MINNPQFPSNDCMLPAPGHEPAVSPDLAPARPILCGVAIACVLALLVAGGIVCRVALFAGPTHG